MTAVHNGRDVYWQPGIAYVIAVGVLRWRS
jgi:hypothetical protein